MRFTLSVVALFPLFLFGAAHSPGQSKRHSELALKKRLSDVEISKRGGSYSNVRATWYDVGLGACGKTNVPSDFIVALNAPMYGSGYPGPQCWKMITVTCNGKTTNAQITDECMGCPGNGGIDMSKGLFQYFSDLGAGVISCDWHFADDSSDNGGDSGGSDNGNNGDDQPKTTTTHKAAPKPTTTWTPPPPPTTTSHKPKPTTHSTTSTTKTTLSSSTHSTTKSSSSAAVQTPTYTGPQNLQNLFEAVMGIGGLVVGVAE